MKKLTRVTTALAFTMALAAPALAIAAPANLDQYGCRAEGSAYKCYSGSQTGKSFDSQSDMLSKTGMHSSGPAINTTGTTSMGPGVINNGTGANRAGSTQNSPTTPGTNNAGTGTRGGM